MYAGVIWIRTSGSVTRDGFESVEEAIAWCKSELPSYPLATGWAVYDEFGDEVVGANG